MMATIFQFTLQKYIKLKITILVILVLLFGSTLLASSADSSSSASFYYKTWETGKSIVVNLSKDFWYIHTYPARMTNTDALWTSGFIVTGTIIYIYD